LSVVKVTSTLVLVDRSVTFVPPLTSVDDDDSVATVLPLHDMMIRPPGTSMTFFGPTDAVGLGSGEAGPESGGADTEALGSTDADGLFDGDTLGWLAVGVDDGWPVAVGLVGADAVRVPLVRPDWVGDGVVVVPVVPGRASGTAPLLAVALSDDAAAAEFSLICAETPCGVTSRGVEPPTS